jgi:hypothetical protein
MRERDGHATELPAERRMTSGSMPATAVDVVRRSVLRLHISSLGRTETDVIKKGDSVAPGTPHSSSAPPNPRLQRTALRAAADAER